MKRLILHIILILFILNNTNQIYANDNRVDSLKSVITKSDEKTKLKLYIELAKIYSDNNNDSATKYCNLIINSKISDSLLKYKANAYILLGTIDLNKANHENSLKLFFEAVSISEKINDTKTTIGAYNNIGVCYYDLFDYDKSEEYLLKCLDLIKESKMNINKSNIYNNLGLIAHERQDYDKELNYLTKALVIYKQENDSIGMALIIGNIARVNREKGNLEDALRGFNQSLKYISKSKSFTNIITLNMNIGITYLEMKEYDKALSYLNNGLKMAKENNYKEQEMKLLYNISNVYREINDFKTSLEYFEKYHSINDSLFDKEKHKQISELNIKYKTIKKDKEISLLNKDKLIQEERYSMQKKLMILLSIIIIVIVIFASIIFLFNRRQFILYKNLVKKNIELLNKEDVIEQNKLNKRTNKNITKEQKIEYNTNEFDNEKNLDSKLDESLVLEVSALIIESLEKEKIYLDNELTINKMAEYININRTYLSQIINSHFNKNFSTFINEYRVKAAQKKLLSDNNITIEAISQDVGFKSKSAFNTAFKNYTGVTPSFFIKNSN